MKSAIKGFISLAGYRIEKNHPLEYRGRRLYDRYREYTMIPEALFLDNLKLIWSFAQIQGCVVECGVWRGGMSAAMASVLPDREFFLFDSFEGLPQVKEIDGEGARRWQEDKESPGYHNNCTAEAKIANKAMESTTVKFRVIKGWFNETLPNTKIEAPISILRLDADWYESTWECLVNLYPLVAKGGLVILDDYYAWDGCSRAVHDYLSKHSLTARIHKTTQGVPYLVKKD